MQDRHHFQIAFILGLVILPFVGSLPAAVQHPTMWDILLLPLQGGIAWFCARHWVFPWISWLRNRRTPLNGLAPGLLVDAETWSMDEKHWVSGVLYDRPMLDTVGMTWWTADDRWRVRIDDRLVIAMTSQIRLRSAVDQLARLAR